MEEFLRSLHWQNEWELAMRVAYAGFLGAIIGLEREYRHKDVGIRTMSVVAMGACIFAILSTQLSDKEPTRIAANIVVGIGFLGGGIIYHQQDRTVGLTTAASLWTVAAVGATVGFGLYVLAGTCALMTLFVLATRHLFPRPDDLNKKP